MDSWKQPAGMKPCEKTYTYTGDNKRPTDNICNMCGEPLSALELTNFSFESYVGYGSKHDTEHIKARFCAQCWDKILDDLIGRCKVNPVVGYYM